MCKLIIIDVLGLKFNTTIKGLGLSVFHCSHKKKSFLDHFLEENK